MGTPFFFCDMKGLIVTTAPTTPSSQKLEGMSAKDSKDIANMNPQPGGLLSRLTPIQVNLLYLAVMILMLTAGTTLQGADALWGLIGTEILVILLPALIFLWIKKLPLAATLRFNWPGFRLALLGIVIGIGTWLLDSWLGVVSTVIFGYTINLTPDFLPTTPLKTAVLLAALVISAPICEEILFRGVIQRAYENRPWMAVVLGGLLFALFHMTLSGLGPLIPIALVLGFLAWRSQSLIPGILAHFANNLMAALVVITSTQGINLPVSLPSAPAAVVGLVLAGVGLWLFIRLTSPVVQPAPARRGSPWLAALPLAAGLIIFSILAGIELLIGRFPQALAVLPLELPAENWNEPASWRYELRNPAGEPVGNAECQITQDGETEQLNCEVQNEGYELDLGSSYYSMGQRIENINVDWSITDRSLLEAGLETRIETSVVSTKVTHGAAGTEMQVTYDGKVENLPLPPDAILECELPWRLSGMPFSLGEIYKLTLAYPLKWDQESQASHPMLVDSYLQVNGADIIETPAGRFITWKVLFGNGTTAWYLVDDPHVLVRYNSGMLDYVLTDMD